MRGPRAVGLAGWFATVAAAWLLSGCGGGAADWPDWRGPDRDAISPHVPARLPARPSLLWRRPMTGMGLSGLAVADGRVVVADKDADRTHDVWRCLRAGNGEELWRLSYPAAGDMDYSNSPRACPVIRDGLAYLLGAFGDLHCVRLDDGQVLWRMNIVKHFGATRPQWGMCSTPLIVEDKLIVNPGAPGAAVVALDRRTGREIWRGPGGQAAYASFIVATLGGVRQIVGCDATSLGGWDVSTGRRLWRLVPPHQGDFNVPTPLARAGRLLVASENNGARLYAFDEAGRIRPEPVARNEGLAPDTQTPVVLGGLVFGCWERLHCLDARTLKTLWQAEDKAFDDYCALIAGRGRLLVLTVDGQLLLIQADRARYRLLSRMRLIDDERTEIFSHPALTPGRLFVRDHTAVWCFSLERGSG